MNKENSNTFVTLVALNVTAILVSNITAFKMVSIGPLTLPAAVFLFPMTYILGNIIVEVYGLAKAKRVIWTGFAMNLLMVIFFAFTVLLPSPGFFDGADAYALVLGSAPRVLAAGLTAFLAGSFLNVNIMDKMKAKDGEAKFKWRAAVSSVFGEGIDALIFITLAFYGTMPNSALLIMVLSQAGFKIAYEIIALPLSAYAVDKIREVERGV